MTTRSTLWFWCALACAFALASLFPASAAAQSTIKRPGDRPAYSFEAEPHLVLAPLDPPHDAHGDGFGLGFRGTIEVAPDGFIGKINDSVGVGFGLDWVHYSDFDNSRARGHCTRYETIQDTRVCVEVSGGGADRDYFYLPVVMQWNFWLHRRWSVFGEPGLALYFHDHGSLDFQPFVLYAGGRFHFTDAITLTMRLGYPTFSLGVSFLL